MPTNLWALPFGIFGGDFRVFWNAGVAVLRGLSPYTVSGSFYPPLTSYLCAVFALVPPVVGYILLGFANLIMLVHVGRGRRALAWVLFLPVLFMFLSGNIDLLAVWASQFLGKKGWRSIAAVAVICLKPQMAFVLLPFWLWKWLRDDRLRLVHTGTIVFGLNMLPYAIRPTVFREWVMALRLYNTGANVGMEPGLWQFAAGRPGLVVPILVVSVLIVLLAVLVVRVESVVRAVMILAMPAGHGYDSSTLTMQTPAWLMVPVSWFGAYVAWTHGSAIGHILMPVTVLVWTLFLRLRDWRRTMPKKGFAFRVDRETRVGDGKMVFGWTLAATKDGQDGRPIRFGFYATRGVAEGLAALLRMALPDVQEKFVAFQVAVGRPESKPQGG